MDTTLKVAAKTRRKKEHTPIGRPAGESPKVLLQHISSIAPAPLLSENISQLQHISVPLNQQLSCQLCRGILDRPVKLSCGAIVCSPCCSKWMKQRTKDRLEISCPCCNTHKLESSAIRPPPPLVLSLLAGVLVHCGRECGKLVRLDHHDRHTAGNCHGYYHHHVNSPSKITLSDVLAKPVTLPATQRRSELQGILFDGCLTVIQVVRVPTRGQVCWNSHVLISSLYR